MKFYRTLILLCIFLSYYSEKAYPEQKVSENSIFKKAQLPEAIQICDSLQSEFWNVLRRSVSADSFADQFTAEDSLVCDSVTLINPDLSTWMKFLIVHSNTFNLTGMGSTLRLPDFYYDKVKFCRASTSVSREELPTIYTIIDYEKALPNGIPANYTQCLAAATWYDVNKSSMDPSLFYYFYNLSEVVSTKGTQTFMLLKKLYGKVSQSREDVNKLVEDLFIYSHYLRKTTVPVRQFFHLWPNQESYNLENQLFTDLYFLQYYMSIGDDMITSFDYEVYGLSKLPKSVLNFLKTERRIPYIYD